MKKNLTLFCATLQCGRYNIYLKVKKQASKVAHIQPRPFYSTVQPRPQPKIDFPYHEISGPDICSLICGQAIRGNIAENLSNFFIAQLL